LESVLGVVLLYQFRMFERQMGSSKFLAFTCSTWFVNALLSLGFLVVYPSRGVPSGPYALIFSLLVLFYFEVPATYRFRLLGVNAGDKIMTYLLSLQLLGVQLPSSLISGLFGLLAGIAYRSELFPINRLKIPEFLVRFGRRWILPLIQNPQRRSTTINPNALRPQQQQQQQQQQLRPQNNLFPPPLQQRFGDPPSESMVTALMDMGFSQEEARAALTQTGNDAQLAAALLLEQH